MEANGVDPWARIERLVGVYQANGGLMGELAYVVGKAIGQAHCSLCDITHSTWHRKPEWDRFIASLPVPFELVHLNERDDVVLKASEGSTPCVVAVLKDGPAQRLLESAALESAEGSIDHFADLLRTSVLDLPPTRRVDEPSHP
jgi:hypothetical protein